MRGKIALAVGGVDVTRAARGLSFSSAAMGGYDTLSAQIMLPPEALDLTPATRVRVTDTRSGQVVWSGFVSAPGDQETDARRVDLSAVGLRRVAEDRTARLLYVDRTTDQWMKRPVAQRFTAEAGAGQAPDDAGVLGGAPAIVLSLPPGQAVGSGASAQAAYGGAHATPQGVGAILFARDESQTGGSWNVTVAVAPGELSGTGAWDMVYAAAANSVAGYIERRRGAGDWPDADRYAVIYRLHYSGAATNLTGEGIWSVLAWPCVVGQMVDRWGTRLNMITAANMSYVPATAGEDPITAYVEPHRVMHDLIGQGLLGDVDVAGALIDFSDAHIPQLAYFDPVRPAEVLDTLVTLDSSMFWRITEGAAGLPRPELRKWPEAIRYTLDDRDSYTRQGQASGWANRVAVSYTDAYGRVREVVAAFQVPALDEAGLEVYADPVSLPEGLGGSPDNATRFGVETLRDLYNQPASGTALVGRRIFDHQCGGWVEPWEIEPGSLVQIARTGDVIRLTAVEWDDDNYTARLTLGNPGRSAEERMAAVTGGRAR